MKTTIQTNAATGSMKTASMIRAGSRDMDQRSGLLLPLAGSYFRYRALTSTTGVSEFLAEFPVTCGPC